MTRDSSFDRRGLLAAGAGLALGAGAATGHAAAPAQATRMLSATQFGAVGDGIADDSAALQSAFNSTFAEGGGFLVIPPGRYKVTRTLRIAPEAGSEGDITRQSGVLAHGARIFSAIADGGNVIEIASQSTIRFLLIEGIDILGAGREGHGIVVTCNSKDHYLYNFCLRDTVVQDCGGDGCRLIGNVFEGQIVNGYFRKNRGNGATFAHGRNGGILSSLHVFGCVFGENGAHGAALVNGCYDVGFHGCYFLLNGKFGLAAENGCTLLANCGFENNHQSAPGFDAGDAGIALRSFGTLVGCTAYSLFNQTGLVRADLAAPLVMLGCSGSGGGQAKAAGLARLAGQQSASATIIGCSGRIDYADGFSALELGGSAGGARFGADWHSRNLAQLGDYRLWVDREGRLRIKRGAPAADDDGKIVGA